MEDIERAKEDKYLSKHEKVILHNQAIQQITDITPSLFNDLTECPLNQDFSKIKEWELEHWRPTKVAALISKNYVRHAVKLVILLGEAYTDYKNDDFYDCGYEMGEVV